MFTLSPCKHLLLVNANTNNSSRLLVGHHMRPYSLIVFDPSVSRALAYSVPGIAVYIASIAALLEQGSQMAVPSNTHSPSGQ